MRKTFIETLCKEAEKNNKIYLLVGDLGFSVIEPFANKFPERFINVGVAEQNMIGVAAGICLSDPENIVFVYSIANFPTLRALEQIRNDVCYHNLNVNIIAVGSGLCYGTSGYSHYAVEDLSIMASLPNIVVTSPSDDIDVESITKKALKVKSPFYIPLGKNNEIRVNNFDSDIEIGNFYYVNEYHEDIETLIISTGTLVSESVKLVSIMDENSCKCNLISIPYIKPLNDKLLSYELLKYNNIYVMDEHKKHGGLGMLISEIMVQNKINPNVFKSFYLPDELKIVGNQTELREEYGLSADQIYNKIKK